MTRFHSVSLFSLVVASSVLAACNDNDDEKQETVVQIRKQCPRQSLSRLLPENYGYTADSGSPVARNYYREIGSTRESVDRATGEGGVIDENQSAACNAVHAAFGSDGWVNMLEDSEALHVSVNFRFYFDDSVFDSYDDWVASGKPKQQEAYVTEAELSIGYSQDYSSIVKHTVEMFCNDDVFTRYWERAPISNAMNSIWCGEDATTQETQCLGRAVGQNMTYCEFNGQVTVPDNNKQLHNIHIEGFIEYGDDASYWLTIESFSAGEGTLL